MDSQHVKLAQTIVDHSCQILKDDNVLIHYVGDCPRLLVKAIIEAVVAVGGNVFIKNTHLELERIVINHANKKGIQLWGDIDAYQMSKMDAYIYISGPDNDSEMSSVSAAQLSLYNQLYLKPVHMDIRAPQTKWVALRYPTAAMAQKAKKDTDWFEKFYYQVCTLDYSKMRQAMNHLVNYMTKTDQVKIIGPGTNLSFSIKGMKVIPCAGEMNLPDGEVFTAPVKESINGHISYNVPSVYQGQTYENIQFKFEKGKIVKADCNHKEKLNALLNTDEGARYIGEFAIGVNPLIQEPMGDTLFDEKIKGSFHLTPGNAYDFAPNGNHSSIHWDLVSIQTPEYGGGEIYFDGVLIRKEGRFVLPELEALNPENLL